MHHAPKAPAQDSQNSDAFCDLPAILVLADGTCLEGVAAGARGVAMGEIVFNTSMSGYQEILTDPSYAGQLVTFTVPHIGNYGVSPRDMESDAIKARGMIVRSLTEIPSNYRSQHSLQSWLADHGTVAIAEVDTRELTRKLRDGGVMMAAIVHGATRADAAHWVERLGQGPDYGSIDWVAEVAVGAPARVVVHARGADGGAQGLEEADVALLPLEAPPALAEADDAGRPHLVVVDFGVKQSILRHAHAAGFRLTLVPRTLSADKIAALGPDAVLLSNGPGDPAQMDAFLPGIRELVAQYPTLGICLGHQLLARAFGARTFKLGFGHRGPNQPVMDLASRKVAMTSQNHGYAVSAEGLGQELEVTEINLNDQTVAGLRHRELPFFSVQYHPEAGPGPHDARGIFARFAALAGISAAGRAVAPATAGS